MPVLGKREGESLNRQITVSGAEVFDPYARAWVPVASPRGAELARLKAVWNVRAVAARRWAREASTRPGTKRPANASANAAPNAAPNASESKRLAKFLERLTLGKNRD